MLLYNFFPLLVFNLILERDTYYGSEDDPIVTACLVVEGGDPLDHAVYFIVETSANDSAGEFTVYRNDYIYVIFLS